MRQQWQIDILRSSLLLVNVAGVFKVLVIQLVICGQHDPWQRSETFDHVNGREEVTCLQRRRTSNPSRTEHDGFHIRPLAMTMAQAWECHLARMLLAAMLCFPLSASSGPVGNCADLKRQIERSRAPGEPAAFEVTLAAGSLLECSEAVSASSDRSVRTCVLE